jgi:hypothetical protein
MRKISIAEFAAENGINSIDFVKIDTDGHDLEAAASSRNALRRSNILGFMVEFFLRDRSIERELVPKRLKR